MPDKQITKVLRFLRLYLGATYKALDGALEPRVQMLLLTFDERMHVRVLPHYHDLNDHLTEHLPALERPLAGYLDLSYPYYEHFFSALDAYDRRNDLTCYYAGPHRHQRTVVFVRIGLKASVANQYYRLKGDHPARSLLDALRREILVDVETLLTRMESGGSLLAIDYSDTLRRAAKTFLRVLTPERVWHATYEKLNEISTLSYERAENTGRLFMIPGLKTKEEPLHENLRTILLFDQRIPLANSRYVRKLLEITENQVGLISDGEFILGIGTLSGDYDLSREDLFTVVFTGSYRWEVHHKDKRMMRVAFEQVELPKAKIGYRRFKETMRCTFDGLDEEDIHYFYAVLLEAMKQKKGALIIISEEATQEVIRLKNQGFAVAPQIVQAAMVRDLATIDGAILIDPAGAIHGIGVILDGMASESGDPSRGARYNSALRYVETAVNKGTDRVMAIVVSEDGYTDLITPQSLGRTNCRLPK